MKSRFVYFAANYRTSLYRDEAVPMKNRTAPIARGRRAQWGGINHVQPTPHPPPRHQGGSPRR